jgi:hypothetical protein
MPFMMFTPSEEDLALVLTTTSIQPHRAHHDRRRRREPLFYRFPTIFTAFCDENDGAGTIIRMADRTAGRSPIDDRRPSEHHHKDPQPQRGGAYRDLKRGPRNENPLGFLGVPKG